MIPSLLGSAYILVFFHINKRYPKWVPIKYIRTKNGDQKLWIHFYPECYKNGSYDKYSD